MTLAWLGEIQTQDRGYITYLFRCKCNTFFFKYLPNTCQTCWHISKKSVLITYPIDWSIFRFGSSTLCFFFPPTHLNTIKLQVFCILEPKLTLTYQVCGHQHKKCINNHLMDHEHIHGQDGTTSWRRNRCLMLINRALSTLLILIISERRWLKEKHPEWWISHHKRLPMRFMNSYVDS